MNKNQGLLLLIGAGILALIFFRKRDPDLEKQRNNPFLGGGGGTVPGGVPTQQANSVVSDVYGAAGAVTTAVKNILGLFPNKNNSPAPETAFVGAQAPINAGAITAPTAAAVNASGYDFSPSYYNSQYGSIA